MNKIHQVKKKKRSQKPINCLSWKVKKVLKTSYRAIKYLSGLELYGGEKRIIRKKNLN